MNPVPFSQVRLLDLFWAPRQELNRTVTLPMIHQQCRESGRIDALRLDWKPGDPNRPHVFWESDVAKWMEAVSYTLAVDPDPLLERQLNDVIALVQKAQQPDGYLNAYYTVVEPGRRFTNLRDKHELYCAGHLMEAGVAHFQATGQRTLLEVACRLADYIDTTLGRDPGKLRGYCGHEEIELALVRLYRATGQKRYLDLSLYFVEERGQQPHFFDLEAEARGEEPQTYWARSHEYTQSHLPVRDQARAVGHSVRALYLYSAMADLARETGDVTLWETCLRLWESVYQRQLYLTGGVGSSRENEGFSFDYHLPNDTAYAETCAAIASVFFNHRMLHYDCDSRYADEMERALYNGVRSAISHDATRFFYVNPLAMFPHEARVEDPYHKPVRVGRFECACCSPNFARLLASLGGYFYSIANDEVTVHLYAASAVVLKVNQRTVSFQQETNYPWDGTVRLTVLPQPQATFRLKLRLPGWCRQARLLVNKESQPLRMEKGYMVLDRTWSSGDVVELNFAMSVERIYSHPLVRHNSGRIALQRGPIVYCLESVDNGADLAALSLPPHMILSAEFEPRLLGGMVVLNGKGHRKRNVGLYSYAAPIDEPVDLRAIPYFAWGNRGVNEMMVWISEY